MHAEVDLGRRGDAIGAVAVEDLVQVRGDDPLLAGLAGELAVEAQGLDDLLDLPHVAVGAGLDDVLRQQPRADELLGDGRGAAVARP